MNIKKRANHLKSNIPAVFIALKDKETPFTAKVLAGLTVGYALSPIDLIPDFILPAMVALTIRCVPKEIWIRSKEKSQGLWQNGKPKKWYYSIPIIFIWGIVMWIIVKAVWL